jgi:uncharacterized protein YodC (DUF2158 family)
MSLPIGTKVRLASGGPEMLVLDMDENGQVLCAWGRTEDEERWFPTVIVDVIRKIHTLEEGDPRIGRLVLKPIPLKPPIKDHRDDR